MKRLIMIGLAVIVTAALLGVFAVNGNDASAAKEKPIFVGQWEAIDVFDGSYMTMKITPGLTVKLVDDWASACPEGGSATWKGKGELLDPFLLEVDGQVRCKIGHETWEWPTYFESITPDALTDESGNLWTRMP